MRSGRRRRRSCRLRSFAVAVGRSCGVCVAVACGRRRSSSRRCRSAVAVALGLVTSSARLQNVLCRQ